MNYRGKKVLVTGAYGFIGSHLTEELVRVEANVTALTLYTGLIDIVRATTGTNKPILSEQSYIWPEKSEVRELIASADFFRTASGWSPKVDLATGIGHTVGW